jgi:hypothetical protein
VRLTATDNVGASTTTVTNLFPETVQLTFQTQPVGLQLLLGGVTYTTPVTITAAKGWSFTVGGPTQIGPDGKQYDLTSWSDGGAPTHNLLTPDTDATFTATFTTTATTATPTPTPSNTPTNTPTRTATPANTPTSTTTPANGSLFADGFETGDFSQWTTSVLGPAAGSVKAVIPSAAYTGAFGARLSNGVGGKVSNGSSVSKTFSAPANQVVSAQTRIYLSSLAGTGTLRLLQLRDSVSGQAVVRVRTVNGVAQLLLVRRDRTQVATNFATPLTSGSWHLVELMYDWSGAQPVGQVWVDGVLQARIVDSTAGTAIVPNTVFCMVYEEVTTATADAYFDDVRVASGFIGSGPIPTVTPTNTPTLTSTP